MFLGSLLTACAPHMCTHTFTLILAFHSCLLRSIGFMPEICLWLYQIQTPSLDLGTLCWHGDSSSGDSVGETCLEVKAEGAGKVCWVSLQVRDAAWLDYPWVSGLQGAWPVGSSVIPREWMSSSSQLNQKTLNMLYRVGQTLNGDLEIKPISQHQQ